MWRRQGTDGVKLILGALILVLLAPAGVSADACHAEVEADLEHKSRDGDFTHLQFSVDVSTQASCGKILYDLVIEEMLPNSQTKRVRLPNVLTLHDGSARALIRHKMPGSHEMVSYEAKVVSCEICEDA